MTTICVLDLIKQANLESDGTIQQMADKKEKISDIDYINKMTQISSGTLASCIRSIPNTNQQNSNNYDVIDSVRRSFSDFVTYKLTKNVRFKHWQDAWKAFESTITSK